MSIHSSFRAAGALAGHRNVLSRTERIHKLQEEGRWKQGEDSVTGLPKVRSIKIAMKKKKKEAEEGAEAEVASDGK